MGQAVNVRSEGIETLSLIAIVKVMGTFYDQRYSSFSVAACPA